MQPAPSAQGSQGGQTGHPRGFAFIEFVEPVAAEKALSGKAKSKPAHHMVADCLVSAATSGVWVYSLRCRFGSRESRSVKMRRFVKLRRTYIIIYCTCRSHRLDIDTMWVGSPASCVLPRRVLSARQASRPDSSLVSPSLWTPPSGNVARTPPSLHLSHQFALRRCCTS